MTTINWLHLSDLHCGAEGMGDLWPIVEDKLFRDLRDLVQIAGPVDLVLFTGDLTQQGTETEFVQLDGHLEKLWRQFRSLGCEPEFLAVPGNHDLVRPTASDDSALLNLLHLWHLPQVQQPFWANADSPQRRLVAEAFANYAQWWKSPSVPKVESAADGILPGDFSATFEKAGFKLGVVGLNSAFRQLVSGNLEGKLGLHVRQFHRACCEQGPDWVKERDVSLLMTHHPPCWLDDQGQTCLRGEIHDPEWFAAHLFGHRHEADLTSLAEGAAKPRRWLQSVSLFAVEGWGEEKKGKRSHGYALCQLAVDDGRAKFRMWPRVAERLQNGTLRFVRNQVLDLREDDGGTEPMPIKLKGAPAGVKDEKDRDESLSPKMTAADRQLALVRYLEHIVRRNRLLQVQGIRSSGQLDTIELDRIYVRLRTTRQRAAELDERWLAEEASLAPGERRRLPEGSKEITETVTVPVEEALAGERRLVVLGDPGSGKTTLLRYLARVYARDMAENTNLVQEKLGLAEKGCLPILLSLRQVASCLPEQPGPAEATEGHAVMLGFLAQALKNERIEVAADFFDPWLTGGTAVILLDGLDEVADPDLRRRVSKLVERFTQAYPECRYVVTSRIVGYTGAARLGENYKTTTVRDFTMADVEQFLCNWHRMVAERQMGPGADAETCAAQQTELLLAAIQSSERIRELAINPLMLTAIAMAHRERVKLPDRRAELYAELVDVFLGKWAEAQGVRETPILADRPFDAGDKRLMLQNVALHMHEQALKELDVGDLLSLLMPLFMDIVKEKREAGRAAERFLRVIEERTGLLSARGARTYSFSHLTFQEYLAALAVAGRDDYVAYTLGRAPDPWWREVVRLEAGHLSTLSKERTTKLIEAIANLKEEPAPYHNLVLARDCLGDVGASRVRGNLEATVLARLRTELERPAEPATAGFKETEVVRDWTERRATATEALGGAAAGYWSGPFGEPEWILVPSGEFWMGDGKEAQRVFLDEYSISRVLVTNAQYRLFVERAGYSVPRLWEDDRPPRGLESHPVVGVTWFDTIAYCRWLGRLTGKRITLPSEAEWEKAARGDKDKRAYPWGDTFDAQRCNCYELGIGKTTPVGMFPEGASPYGCLDMSGNVWEWTRSLYGKYPYPKDPKGRQRRENIETPKSESRVLRGGSFNYDQDNVRCADRIRHDPGYRYLNIGFRVAASPLASGL